jgi:hypothetical protein
MYHRLMHIRIILLAALIFNISAGTYQIFEIPFIRHRNA